MTIVRYFATAAVVVAGLACQAGAASAASTDAGVDLLAASAAVSDDDQDGAPGVMAREAEARGRANEAVHNRNRRGRGR